jgi:hypothetical protein
MLESRLNSDWIAFQLIGGDTTEGVRNAVKALVEYGTEMFEIEAPDSGQARADHFVKMNAGFDPLLRNLHDEIIKLRHSSWFEEV